MTHRDRLGDPPGRREAAGDAGHRQGLPTPPAVRPGDRHGGFPESCGRRLSGPGADSVARGSRCPAPPRHALLAEILWPKNWGKPSLCVNIKDLWYKTAAMQLSKSSAAPALLFAIGLIFGTASSAAQGTAQGAEPGRRVDLELVLAVDASSSVSAGEFELQIQGLAQAFRDPRVLQAIHASGELGLAVSLANRQWAASSMAQAPVPGKAPRRPSCLGLTRLI